MSFPGSMSTGGALKIVLMGQGGVGKTAMVLRWTSGEFPDTYMPTIGDMYTRDIEVPNVGPRHIEIDDTAGQEAYHDLKKEKMSSGHGYLLVYSITDDTSFSKLDRLREEIVRAQAGRVVPIFLVGTKADLSADRAVSEKERLAKARAWGAKSFEISSKANTNVNETFMDIIVASIQASGDYSIGASGGSVMGAGMTAPDPYSVRKKKVCAFL